MCGLYFYNKYFNTMITAITKPFRSVKKKEWAIYHNVGAQQDAERFSLIDSVLDGELSEVKKTKKEANAFTKPNLLLQVWVFLKNKF